MSGFWRARASAFSAAARGLRLLFRNEVHARLHLAAAAAVAALAAALGLPPLHCAVLALAAGLVLAAEALNTALEELADAAVPARHPQIARAKDVAAGAVLLAALAAVAVGLLLLGPPLWHALQNY